MCKVSDSGMPLQNFVLRKYYARVQKFCYKDDWYSIVYSRQTMETQNNFKNELKQIDISILYATIKNSVMKKYSVAWYTVTTYC